MNQGAARTFATPRRVHERGNFFLVFPLPQMSLFSSAIALQQTLLWGEGTAILGNFEWSTDVSLGFVAGILE